METEERNLKVQELNVAYRISGKGFPVLILPGWGGSLETWKGFFDEVSTNQYRFIVLDLPGFGKSDAPKKAWSVDDYVDFVIAFSEKLMISEFILVGHSFGGRISIKLSNRYREKVKKLVLIAAAGIKHKKSLKQKIGNKTARIGKKFFEYPFLKRYFNFFRKLFYKLLREKDYLNTEGTMTETFKNVIAEDLTASLSSITTKTLIVWGTSDKMVPVSDAYLMDEKIRNSQLEILEGAGHGIHKEMPKRLFRIIINFLNKQ